MKTIPQYLSYEELEKLIRSLPTPMIKEAVTIMYVYALRINELCSLDRSNVDLSKDVIRIEGKGGYIRELPIKEYTREILINAMRRPGHLFNLSVRSLRNYIYLAASRSKIGHVHPHMIRHSRATHLMNEGTELQDIKAWLRHANIASTLIYTHVALERLRATIS